MVPQPVGEPLGISQELLDCERHDHLAAISRLKCLIKLKKLIKTKINSEDRKYRSEHEHLNIHNQKQSLLS